MERMTNLPRFVNSTGDYVDIEAVLDEISEAFVEAADTARSNTLDALRELSDAATQGAWTHDSVATPEELWFGRGYESVGVGDNEFIGGSAADAAFIAAAVNYVRARLASATPSKPEPKTA
jgi:hypothetical protein